ncbi:MAG: glycoside hydrolase family 31 protein [Bacteroidales bacterium]|nr:glycoside hydrolase family 31 protein [Bacteroidales bacterium]
MKKLLSSAMCLVSLLAMSQNPPAEKTAVVNAGNARFTVLTSGLIRMEWNENAAFTDNQSFVIVNRNLPTPEFDTKKRGDKLIISTEKLILEYKLDSGKFSGDNLSIKSAKDFFKFSWKPGDAQKENLKGTYRTLDGCDGQYSIYRKENIQLEDGLLAKDGWTLLDDSQSFLFDNDKDWQWVIPRSDNSSQDWYFFAYGHDYKSAIYDYQLVAGKVPMPPRYAFGYWWSRYWSYSDNELRSLIANCEMYNIPLDVLVIDMDWHKTFRDGEMGTDEFGQSVGWTGWTWNNNLFPDPDKFLKWLKSQDLKITFNLHPASGFAPYEKQYEEMARRMDFDTSTGKNIPWEASNKKFMSNFFDVFIRPMEKAGVDFWWLDWQQWKYDKKIADLSNTWWLNYLFFSDMEKNREERPMLYHRWGGMGNHRYQIGFSGDALITWKSLDFQPYFTNCASNVLYGYWSHDIGGHMIENGITRTAGYTMDPELYTRWLQYGVFSPILRTHSTKDARIKKEIWNFGGDYFRAQYEAIQLRYKLVPYIYAMSRYCYETGISLCRPMYYEYPEATQSYSYSREYMFGDDILISPIVTPSEDGLSTVHVWLPDGDDWYEWYSGTLFHGGQELERTFALDEYPIYVKAGAIVPMYDKAHKLTEEPSAVVFSFFPGADGEAVYYEDNGNDKYYAEQYATTRIVSNREDDNLKITIAPREGTYAGMQGSCDYKLMLYGVTMPKSVTLNGMPIEFAYIGSSLAVSIDLGELSCSDNKEITISFDASAPEINDGLVRKFKRLSAAVTGLKFRNDQIIVSDIVGRAEETNRMLEYSPANFNAIIADFNRNYARLSEGLDEMRVTPEYKEWFLKVMR